LTLPITSRTAPPSHLQRLKPSLKWSRKYSTRWVDIQENLLSLQGKDAIGTGVARLEGSLRGRLVSSQRARKLFSH
jgi:hypothetical protein